MSKMPGLMLNATISVTKEEVIYSSVDSVENWVKQALAERLARMIMDRVEFTCTVDPTDDHRIYRMETIVCKPNDFNRYVEDEINDRIDRHISG